GHPRLARVLQPTVGEAEDVHEIDHEDPGGVALFLLADLGQSLGGHAAIVRPLVAVGEDAVGDNLAFAGEPGHRAPRAELRIVGMRSDDHHALDALGHVVSCARWCAARSFYPDLL